ncbi:phage tail sheath C-terminal domain-containing protein [Actinoplanes sp. ATCC 53533]|uniref:phage tail sheath family protein n=1 Tax=Actinoplanes sp. ATCC 53533 TaxID=1288362 RepID=UPI0018F56492|nr:phage tail sheath C-terminal domain-containing protein [Actinoplanes sp. ATCC 53533]
MSKWANNATEGGHWWTFPLAVRGFFENGGQRLFVKRVLSRTAKPAKATLTSGLSSEIVQDAGPGSTVIEVRHLLGFAGGNQDIKIFRGDTDQELQTVQVKSYAVGARATVELAAGLTDAVRVGRGDYIAVRPGAELGDAVTFTASSGGGWGRNLRVRLRPVVGAQLPLLADPSEGELFVTRLVDPVRKADDPVRVPADDLGELPDDVWVLIEGRRFKAARSDRDAAGNVTLTLTNPFPPGEVTFDWDAGTAVQRVRLANRGATNTVRIGGAARLYSGALLQFDNGAALTVREVDGAPVGDLVTLTENVTGRYFDNQRVLLIEAETTARFTDEDGDVTEEIFGNLRWGLDEPDGVVRAVSARSELVTASAPGPLVSAGPWFAGGERAWTPLDEDGLDNYQDLVPRDFVGVDGGSGRRTGIVALEDIDDVAICAVPGVWSGTVQQALIGHCEELKDRFAILDPQDGLGVDEILDFRAPYDTKYAALYYPWVVLNHPVTGLPTNVPPAGHIAGIYARTDVERGVHKAPANAIVRGINLRDGLAGDLTRRHQDLLNPRGINALRYFPGMGNRVWGARTLSSDSAWRYVNVRRLFIFLEESIEEGTQWVVFEPNAEPLWALVKQTVENFLDTVWRSGALAGTSPDEAYFVACDRTTMTEADLQNGRLICVIGVAPVFPAEFVIFRIQQKTRETQPA